MNLPSGARPGLPVSDPTLDDRGRLLLDSYWREYATLREELLLTIRSRNQLLSFGFAALGITLGAGIVNGVSRGAGSTYVFWGLFAVLPVLMAGIYGLWCSEFLRMVRASQHLALLESAINSLLGGDGTGSTNLRPAALSWEIYLRDPKHRPATPSPWPRKLYRQWQDARDMVGYWRGSTMIDLHVPLTAFVGIVILGLPYLSHALPHSPDQWILRWFPGLGVVVLAPQVYFFWRAKVMYSRPLDIDKVRDAVRGSAQNFDGRDGSTPV